MLDPDDRDAGLADVADGGDELEAFALGQAAGDLVEQQKPRRRRERAGHFQPLALQQRQRACERLARLMSPSRSRISPQDCATSRSDLRRP